MAMNHGIYIRPGFIDLPMNEALQKHGSFLRARDVVVQIELQNVIGRNEFGSQRPPHKISLRIRGIPHAHVPVSVKHPLGRKNAVCRHQIFDSAGSLNWCLRKQETSQRPGRDRAANKLSSVEHPLTLSEPDRESQLSLRIKSVTYILSDFGPWYFPVRERLSSAPPDKIFLRRKRRLR